MSTNPEQLKTTLDELRRELAKIDQVDPALREQLSQTLAEIQTALQSKAISTSNEPPASKAARRESLVERLQDSARHFEASHPVLAENIGGLIDTLGRSGI